MSDDLAVDVFVSRLSDRLAKWRTRVKLSLTTWVCTLVLAGGALSIAASIGPATSLESVDVPKAVVADLTSIPVAKTEAAPQVEQEPAGRSLASSTSNAMPFESALDAFGGKMQPIIVLMFTVFICIGIWRFIFTEDSYSAAPMVGVGFMGLFASLLLWPFFSGDGSSDSRSADAPNSISTPALAEQGLTLKEMVLRSRYANLPEGIYVLAQEAIKIEPPKRTTDQRQTINAAATNLQQSMKFAARPDVVYLIERDAFGKPVSRAAQQYVQSKLSNKAAATQIGRVLGQLSLIAFLASLICGAIKSMINARLRRLRKLIDQHKPKADEPLEAA